MRARPGMVALLVYQAFFLNVFLPGHTRGAITIDGKHSGDCCNSCCSSKAMTNKGAPGEPSQRDKDNCAICHFAARVTAPPVIVLTLPKLGLLETLPFPQPDAVDSVPLHSPHLGRGPPAAC